MEEKAQSLRTVREALPTRRKVLSKSRERRGCIPSHRRQQGREGKGRLVQRAGRVFLVENFAQDPGHCRDRPYLGPTGLYL